MGAKLLPRDRTCTVGPEREAFNVRYEDDW